MKVIVDTDFLSCFLKINRLDLIRKLFNVTQVRITPSVYEEISRSDLLPVMVKTTWVVIEPHRGVIEMSKDLEADFKFLGAGEIESILLTLSREDSVLLTNDNQARRVSKKHGAVAYSIPDTLLACKRVNLLDREDLSTIIRDMKEKDFYHFKEEVEKLLLE